jgi:hypothetical protein
VLYYHTDPQRQLIREHVDQLAQDMRRSRQPDVEDPKWRRLAAELIQRIEPRHRRQRHHAPAYDV